MTFGSKVLLTGSILVLFILIGLDQSRTFYCLSEGQCITVWKRLDNKCYIIPGKYYWILSPSNNYLKTSNMQYLTLYYSEELPKKIIVRNQSTSNEKDEYKIIGNPKGDWEFLEYSEQYKLILYKTEARKFKDVKATTNYLDLDIKENYAIDKTGRKLE